MNKSTFAGSGFGPAHQSDSAPADRLSRGGEPAAVRLGADAAQHRFGHAYHRWSMAHALVVVALTVCAEVHYIRPAALALLALWILPAFWMLFQTGVHNHPDGAGPNLANFLTAVRAGAAFGLVVLLAAAAAAPTVREIEMGRSAWMLVGALIAVELTDFFDGRIARRLHAGGFGSTWDMECDALFVLALSLAGRHLYDAPLSAVAIGLTRYLYALVSGRASQLVGPPAAYKQYARTVTAVVSVALIGALSPALAPGVRAALYRTMLILLLTSFGWDLLLRHRLADQSHEALKNVPSRTTSTAHRSWR